MFDENGIITEEFKTNELPELLGDDYYNDPQTKQQPTQVFANIKDKATLVKNYVNAQRTISKHGEELKKATEGMVKVPGEGATEDEIAAWRKTRGVPDKPEGYTLKIPEKDSEGYKAIAEIVQNVAHKIGMSPSEVHEIWDTVIPAVSAQADETVKKGMELLEADKNSLKEKHKAKYDSFIKETDKVMSAFDIQDPATKEINPIGTNFRKLMETMGILDTPAVRDFLAAVAPNISEGGSHLGGGGGEKEGEGWFTDYSEVEEH